jgi:hypothetical protein
MYLILGSWNFCSYVQSVRDLSTLKKIPCLQKNLSKHYHAGKKERFTIKLTTGHRNLHAYVGTFLLPIQQQTYYGIVKIRNTYVLKDTILLLLILQIQRHRCSRLQRFVKICRKCFCFQTQSALGYSWRCKFLQRGRCNSRSNMDWPPLKKTSEVVYLYNILRHQFLCICIPICVRKMLTKSSYQLLVGGSWYVGHIHTLEQLKSNRLH